MNQLTLDERPRSFDDMVGQKSIVKELRNLSKTMNFPPIITLEGSTGSGKTTTALIIAQLLNCKSPIKQEDGTHVPCQECNSCKDILAGTLSRDVKLKACSGMGKDDLIAWADELHIRPMYDKNKIFILDEAQELSNPKTQGPLLNILEKSYKNVYIILTTMNVEKLNRAIISRTVPYKFRPITKDDIFEYLFKLLGKLDPEEKIPASFIEGGMSVIADYSAGSVREALSYFQRAIQGELWTKEQIIEGLGFVDTETAANLIIKLLKKDWSFFSDIEEKKIVTEELFQLSWISLIDACVYRQHKDVAKEDFRWGFVKKYATFDTVVELEQYFYKIKTECPTYFEHKVFLHNLVEYMSGQPLLKEKVDRELQTPRPVGKMVPESKESEPVIKRRPVST